MTTSDSKGFELGSVTRTEWGPCARSPLHAPTGHRHPVDRDRVPAPRADDEAAFGRREGRQNCGHVDVRRRFDGQRGGVLDEAIFAYGEPMSAEIDASLPAERDRALRLAIDRDDGARLIGLYVEASRARLGRAEKVLRAVCRIGPDER
jgi:hypothetical protein